MVGGPGKHREAALANRRQITNSAVYHNACGAAFLRDGGHDVAHQGSADIAPAVHHQHLPGAQDFQRLMNRAIVTARDFHGQGGADHGPFNAMEWRKWRTRQTIQAITDNGRRGAGISGNPEYGGCCCQNWR